MMGGLVYMTGPPGRPLRAGTSVNDIMGGMFGAIGVLAALRERDRTGTRPGSAERAVRELRVPLRQHMQQYSMTGEPPPPMPSRVSAWSVYDVFTLAGRRAALHRRRQRQAVPHAVPVLEAPDLLDDAGIRDQCAAGRGAAGAAGAAGARSCATIASTSCRPGSRRPACPMRRSCGPSSCCDDPHLKASGGLVPMQTDDGGTTDVVLLPLLMGGRRPGVRRPCRA